MAIDGRRVSYALLLSFVASAATLSRVVPPAYLGLQARIVTKRLDDQRIEL